MKTKLLLIVFLFTVFTASAQWTATSGINGGGVQKVSADLNRLLMLETDGRLRVSYDSAANWNFFGDTLGIPEIVDYDRIGPYLLASTSGGVYRSADDGISWTNNSSGLQDSSCYQITTAGDKIFVGTNQGFYMSQDSGLSWTNLSTSMNFNWVHDFLINDSLIIVSQSTGGFWQTEDYGQTWVPSGIGPLNARCFLGEGDTVYAGCLPGLYRSVNRGQTWIQIGTPYFAGVFVMSIIRDQGKIWASTADADVYYSPDNGASWILSTHGLTDNESVVSLAAAYNFLFAGFQTDGGVYRSTDGGLNWYSASKGIRRTSVMSIATNGQELVACNLTGGSFFSANNGNNWSSVNANLGNGFSRDIWMSGDSLYLARVSGLWRSLDYGQTWAQLHNHNSIGVYAKGNHIVSVSNWDTIQVSTDGGSSWTASYYCASQMSNYLWFLGNEEELYTYVNYQLCRSTDGGFNWNPVSNAPGFLAAPCFYSDTVLYAVGGNDLYKTIDHGQTWTQLVSMWSVLQPQHFARSMDSYGSLLFLGDGTVSGNHSSHVFYSYNGGASWLPLGAAFDGGDVWSLVHDSVYLYAGTNRGVWKYPLSVISGLAENADAIHSTAQIFPNPASGMVTVTLPEKESTIRLFDISGNLLLEEKVNGNQATFDLSVFASGLYFIRIETKSGVQTQKLVRE